MHRSAVLKSGAMTVACAPLALAAGLAAAQGISPVERQFADGTIATFYGQINKGFLRYDDGIETGTYDVIDNNNFPTLFGFLYSRPVTPEWTFGTRLEFQYDPYNTGAANILGDNADFDVSLQNNLRWADLQLENARIGKFYAGQGSMASDDTAEVDLSGTGVIAYSGVGDSAGGQIIRATNAPTSDESFTQFTISNAFTNYDGLGRKMRLRYDSPKFNGFGVKTSWGQDVLNDNSDNLYDIAATYGNVFANLQVAGAIAYAWQGSGTRNLNGSGSVLHTPTGLNLTVAGGNNDGETTDGAYGYAKLGWIADFWSGGSSHFSIDYYGGSDITVAGSTSESYGIAYVQDFDRISTQFWATHRQYDYDDDEEFDDGTRREYGDGQAVFAGLRFRW